MSENKLWGGRFKKGIDPLLEKFNASIQIDKRLWRQEISVNTAYLELLKDSNVLSVEEAGLLRKALKETAEEFESDTFKYAPSDEDIHTAVERRLKEKTGKAGEKLYTGKSRNDVIVTEEMMFLKNAVENIASGITDLQTAIINLAEKESNTVLPGYTHLRQAQPVLFSHYVLSLAWALQRDKGRLKGLKKRLNILPLGAGAFAGSSQNVDLRKAAELLGFEYPCRNSIDAVSDRDYFIEFLNSLAVLSIHLSRYAEDFILYSSREFNFIQIDDSYCTGSSIMPQKKNPDALELIRAQSGVIQGHLNTLMSVLKGVPLTYAKDLQEDKKPVFAAIDSASACLKLFAGIVNTLSVNKNRMREAIDWQVYATDLADYLVNKNIPFRTAHEITGKIVVFCLDNNYTFLSLPLKKYKEFSSAFKDDIKGIFDPEYSVNTRKLPGGTAFEAVKEQTGLLKSLL